MRVRAYEQLDLAPAGPGERERPDPECPAGGHVEDDVVRGGARGRPRAGQGLGERDEEALVVSLSRIGAALKRAYGRCAAGVPWCRPRRRRRRRRSRGA
jgi:hypothetical protein